MRSRQKGHLCLDPLRMVQDLLATLSYPEFWSTKRAAGRKGGSRAQRAREGVDEQTEERREMMGRQIASKYPITSIDIILKICNFAAAEKVQEQCEILCLSVCLYTNTGARRTIFPELFEYKLEPSALKHSRAQFLRTRAISHIIVTQASKLS